jgi:hypothetical protein
VCVLCVHAVTAWCTRFSLWMQLQDPYSHRNASQRVYSRSYPLAFLRALFDPHFKEGSDPRMERWGGDQIECGEGRDPSRWG